MAWAKLAQAGGDVQMNFDGGCVIDDGAHAGHPIVLVVEQHDGELPGTAGNCRRSREELRGMHRDITRDVMSAFYAVKHEVGAGFPEHVYANATAVALHEMGYRVEREVPYEVVFRGVVVGTCRADLVVQSLVIVETKVARAVLPAHRSQCGYYLQAARLSVGMVLNYGENPGLGRVMCP